MEFTLREWSLSDAPSVAKYANDVKIACNLRDGFPHPYTEENAKSYIKSCLTGTDAEKLCRAIVIDGEASGSIGVFLGTDVYRKSAELGYWLAEKHWSKGIMTEAVKQICADAFEKLDIIRIYAEPFGHNLGSRRVLEKAGFTYEGTMKCGVFKDGVLHDYCMYALLRN